MAMPAQRRAFETGSPVISGMRLGPVTNRYTAVIDVPVFKNDVPYRDLVVTIASDVFLRLLNAGNLPKNWLAGIMDADGRYVARVPDNSQTIGQLASEGWRRTAGHDGLSEFKAREGEPTINANAVSHLANWTVGIAIKKAELNAAAWRATRWAIIAGVLLSALSLLLATQLARRAARHLSDLQSNARQLLTEGGSASTHAPTVPELANVWSALKSAADDRDRSEAGLRQSYETYLRLIKNAAFGVFLVDADFRLAEVSTGAHKVFQGVQPLLRRDFGDVLEQVAGAVRKRDHQYLSSHARDW